MASGDPDDRRKLVERLAREWEMAEDEHGKAVAAFEPLAKRLVAAGGASEALEILAQLIEAEHSTKVAAEEFGRVSKALETKLKRPRHRPSGPTSRQRFLQLAIKATGGIDLPSSMAAKVNTEIVAFLMRGQYWPLADEASVLRSVQVERKRLRDDPQLLWESLAGLLTIFQGQEGSNLLPALSPENIDEQACRALLETLGSEDEKNSARLLLARTDEITR